MRLGCLPRSLHGSGTRASGPLGHQQALLCFPSCFCGHRGNGRARRPHAERSSRERPTRHSAHGAPHPAGGRAAEEGQGGRSPPRQSSGGAESCQAQRSVHHGSEGAGSTRRQTAVHCRRILEVPVEHRLHLPTLAPGGHQPGHPTRSRARRNPSLTREPQKSSGNAHHSSVTLSHPFVRATVEAEPAAGQVFVGGGVPGSPRSCSCPAHPSFPVT